MRPIPLLLPCLLLAAPVQAECDLSSLPAGTLVAEIQTTAGTFCIELLDGEDEADNHVENFLWYQERGDIDGTFFHRTVPGFVVQGGGFRVGTGDYEAVPPRPGFTVLNKPCTLDTPAPPPAEPGTEICSVRGNDRGSVALARSSGVSSGTTNWFVNLSDNRVNLDNANEGFTVFGQIVPGGMPVIDAIAALPKADTNHVAWLRSALFASFANLGGAPLHTIPPLLASPFGCFDPVDLSAAVDPSIPPEEQQVAEIDPVFGNIFFLSGGCGTAIPRESFVANPGTAQCPEVDRLSIGLTGPDPPLFRLDPISGERLWFSHTCDEAVEALTQREAWRLDFVDRFNQELVLIESTNVFTVPEPAAGLLQLTIFGSLAWLKRRLR